jgi:hypothetical protein
MFYEGDLVVFFSLGCFVDLFLRQKLCHIVFREIYVEID